MPLDPGTPSRLFPDGFGSPGDIIVSMSDSSVSFIFAVTKMVGGVKFRSSDVGFSSCFSNLPRKRTAQLGLGAGGQIWKGTGELHTRYRATAGAWNMNYRRWVGL